MIFLTNLLAYNIFDAEISPKMSSLSRGTTGMNGFKPYAAGG